MSRLVERLYRAREAVYERPYVLLSAIALAAVLIYLVAIPLPRADGQLVGGDGFRYYMYVRSFWIDFDLDFHNEFQDFYGREGLTVPATGMVHNQYGVGCALLWSPFFLCAHAIAALLNLLGVSTPMDGYSFLYQGFTLLASVVYGFLGVLISFRLAARVFPRRSALLATVAIWLASNVLYYMIVEPSMSQASAMFAVALLVYYWHRTGPERKAGQWGVMGLLAALILMIRVPDVVYLVIPAVGSLSTLLKTISERDLTRLGKHILNNLVFLGMLVLGFVPQMIAWRVIYGGFLAGGRLYGRGVGLDQFNWLSPRILEILFSGWHGLFTWHPVFLLAVVGLIFLWRRDKLATVGLTAAFAAQVYFISSWREWWQGGAFGGRVFVSGGVIFVLGLTALVDWARERRDTLWIEVLALALIAWNALFMIQYRFGFVSLWDPLTFREMVLDKFTLPVEIIRRLLR